MNQPVVTPAMAMQPAGRTAVTTDASRILVVDDNADNRESLSRRLTRRGFSVATAVDGEDALRILAQSPFDLVLLDVMMPGINGLEVLKRIRTTHSPVELPVVMATAQNESQDVVKALELGANDYVTKPLDFAVVMARVTTHLRLKHEVQRVLELEKKLSEQNTELLAAAARTTSELEAAARVQKAFLPKSSPPVPGVKFAWAFEPCQELAGDALNVVDLGQGHVGFYVLDVSGHGVAAALLAVAASRLLSNVGGAESLLIDLDEQGRPRPADPARVAERLNQRLPWNPQTLQYLTLFYATFDANTGLLRYTSAGHPPAIIVRGDGSVTVPLEGSDLPIGVEVHSYHQLEAQLHRGDRLYLYTDGVTEAMDAGREMFEQSRLVEALVRGGDPTLQGVIDGLLADLAAFQGEAAAKDDISILAMSFAG